MAENQTNKQRLLIVDDSKVIRVTARKILQHHFETVEAVDGNNAWDILSGGMEFALVVSDLTMPNLDGFGLLDKIRHSCDPAISGLPVIIITGANDSETTMQRARTAGATDFIGKPFDSVHLLARTQAHASAYVSGRSLAEQAMQLEDTALTDSQTGLANETAFMRRGHQQLAYAIRHGSTLSVAVLEIDRYGELIRQFGEDISSSLLQTVVDALGAGLRQEDSVARVGTARFALLLPAMELTGLHHLADRISTAIRNRTIRTANGPIRISVSIGISAPHAVSRESRFEELLAAAVTQLRAARAGAGISVQPFNDSAATAAPPGASDDPGPAAVAVADATGTAARGHESGLEIHALAPEPETMPFITVEDAASVPADPVVVPLHNHIELEEEIVISGDVGIFSTTVVAHDNAMPDTPVTSGHPAADETGEADAEAVEQQPRVGLWRRLLRLFARNRQPH